MLPFRLEFYLFFLLVWVGTAILLRAGQSMGAKLLLLLASLGVLVSVGWQGALALSALIVVNILLMQWQMKSGSLSVYRVSLALNIGALLCYRIVCDIGTTGAYFISKPNILGFSFILLQLIALQIDTRKKRIQSDGLLDTSLYLLYFPKLYGGPLETPSAIAEYKAFSLLTADRNVAGNLHRVVTGLVKKFAIAQRFEFYVSEYFDKFKYSSPYEVIIAACLFSLQIYFDFSGLVDIVLGLSGLLGIKLPENFNTPFRSQSISEFWRRWHMTLMKWLQQYVFYPVNFAYRRLGSNAFLLATFVTFAISALWHGLAVTFLLWALCHFLYIVYDFFIAKYGKKKKPKSGFHRLLLQAKVFLLFSFSNIFYRATDTGQAFNMLKTCFASSSFFPAHFTNFRDWLIFGCESFRDIFNLRIGIFLAVVFLLLEHRILLFYEKKELSVGFSIIMLLTLLIFGVFNLAERFVYMQF